MSLRTPRAEMGYRDGLQGLEPVANDYQYLRGWFAGKRRRNRGLSSAKAQRKAGEQAIQDKWNCKTYLRAKRCPECGTPNTVRNAANVCLGCSIKARVSA